MFKVKRREEAGGIGDDDEDSDAADEKLIEQFKGGEKEEPEEKVKPVDPDEEEEEEESEEGERTEHTPRQQKRSNRYTEQKRAREDAERRLNETQQQNAFLQQQLQQTQTNVLQQIAASLPKRDEKDPLDEQLADVRKRRAQLHSLYEVKKSANILTQEEYREMLDQDHRLTDEEMRINFERNAARKGLGQTPQQTQAEAIGKFVAMRHPDVFGHPTTKEYAIRTFQNMVLAGAPDGYATLDRAVAETRKAFKLKTPEGERQPAPVTNHTRRVYSGAPAGAGGGTGEKGSRTVAPTKAHMSMAKAMYPDLYKQSPQKAFNKWVREGGGASD